VRKDNRKRHKKGYKFIKSKMRNGHLKFFYLSLYFCDNHYREKKNKKTNLFKWRESQKRILKKKIEKEAKLAISKTVRFSTFRDIEDKGDNIEIGDYMPALNRKTKSPKKVLKGKNDIIIIKKKPSKKRWKLLNNFKN
jgi:hypothetical protein